MLIGACRRVIGAPDLPWLPFEITLRDDASGRDPAHARLRWSMSGGVKRVEGDWREYRTRPCTSVGIRIIACPTCL